MEKKLFQVCIVGGLIGLMTACNLPGRIPESLPVFTPDATRVNPGVTPQVNVITPTSEPIKTKSLVPPTQPALIATPTSPALPRPGAGVEAIYFASPPVMDADWAEFSGVEYLAATVVYGLSSWAGNNDLTASYKLGWDAGYLYLGVKIRDENYVQYAGGEELFKGDSLELLLDVDLAGDYGNDDLTEDDFQLGLSLGKPDVNINPEAYLWFPLNRKGKITGVKIASDRDSAQGITRAEFAIPWSVFGAKPQVGSRFGFAFSVSDNDDSTQNVQQSMVSSSQSRNLVDPTSWGELLLGK